MIEDRNELIQQLHHAYRAGKLSILAGNELAAEAGVPTSTQLFDRVIDIGLESLLERQAGPFAAIAPQLGDSSRACWREDAAAVLERFGIDWKSLLPEFAFGDLPLIDLPVSSLHRQLASMTSATLYTTSHDPILELAKCVAPIAPDSPVEPNLPGQIAALRNTAVHHIFGYIDSDWVSPDLLLEPELASLPSERMASYEQALRAIGAASDAVVLFAFDPSVHLFRWVLRQMYPGASNTLRVAIVPSSGDRTSDWALQQLLDTYNVATIWIYELSEAEPVLRQIKFGLPVQGQAPPWIGDSLQWLSLHLTREQARSGEWQGLARIALEQLVERTRLLFSCQPQEVLKASFLLPLEALDAAPPKLHLASISFPNLSETPISEQLDLLTLAIETGREEGISGPAFVHGSIYDSSDEPGAMGPERNFSKEKLAIWLGTKNYREWRSILSIPILDSAGWVPVAVIALTSNFGKPFWIDLNDEYRKELITTVRRTARYLLLEHGPLQGALSGVAAERYLASPDDKTRSLEDAVPRIALDLRKELQRPERLVNYSGYLCAEWSIRPGNRDSLQVEVSLQPQPPEKGTSGEVKITGGDDAPEAAFLIEAVSGEWDFVPNTASIIAARGQSSPALKLTAKFHALTDANAEEDGDVYINLFQKNRLLKTMHLQVTR